MPGHAEIFDTDIFDERKLNQLNLMRLRVIPFEGFFESNRRARNGSDGHYLAEKIAVSLVDIKEFGRIPGLDQMPRSGRNTKEHGMTERRKHRASTRRVPLQPIGEAFLYRSPHAPLAETCRVCKQVRGRERRESV